MDYFMDTLPRFDAEQDLAPLMPEAVHAREFLPLTGRIAQEQPELSAALAVLKEKIGALDFDKYIQNILALKKAGQTLLVITQRPLQRSLLEYRFKSFFQEAFAVEQVRIISQK